jgi:Golgi nucleoside diphosphatase
VKSFILSFPRTEFYGFSEFWYTSEDVFKLGGVYRFEKFRNAAQVNNFINKNQGDQMIKKNCQIFQRIAQKVAKSKKAQISTTKLNLKAQNIYIKPLLKS